MLAGISEAPFNQDDIQLVRNCVTGFIYDSGPVDGTSDMGVGFSLHPVVHRAPGATKLVSKLIKWFTYGSDALFLTKFESENNEYWNTLYSSINMGAPILFFCSESDQLAPCGVICNFAQRLQDIGGDVELLKWRDSPHLGHYEHFAADYQAAVSSLLEKAASLFSSRIKMQVMPKTCLEGTEDEIPELICHLQKAAVGSKWNLGTFDVNPTGPLSKGRVAASIGDIMNPQEEEREKSTCVSSSTTPSISAHSILGQVLFDACVPKNVEGWDIRFSGSLNGQPFASARRHSPSKSLRCIRRSKL